MAVDLNTITGAIFLEMNREEQLKVLTEVYRELFFNDVKEWRIHAINVLDSQKIILQLQAS